MKLEQAYRKSNMMEKKNEKKNIINYILLISKYFNFLKF